MMRVNSITSSVRTELNFDHARSKVIPFPRASKRRLYQVRVTYHDQVLVYTTELDHSLDAIANAIIMLKIDMDDVDGIQAISVRPTVRGFSC